MLEVSSPPTLVPVSCPMKRIKPNKSETSWTVFPVFSSHRGYGVPVDMILKRVFFVLHLGVMLPVTARETVYAVAGKPFTLPCQTDDGSETIQSVIWNYETIFVIRYRHLGGQPFYNNGDAFKAYKFQDPDKGIFSLVIPNAVGGCYTCEVTRKQHSKQTSSFDLRVLTVTGSHNGYLLEGETLELKLNSSDSVHIEWYSPRKAQVISNKRWTLKDNSRSLQIMNLSIQEDQGTWECHISKLIIPYDVKVIGFLNTPDAEIRYAAVNSSVILSYPLNVKLKDLPDPYEVLLRKLTKDNMNNLKMSIIPINVSSSTGPFKEIPNVQFKDAGQYQCQLRLSRRNLNKSIHLVVMKVSAQPLQLSSTEANVTLCCHISASIDPTSRLRWVYMDGTTKDQVGRENKFCVSARTAGLWQCRLLVKEDVKIRMNYTVTVTAEYSDAHNTFPVLKVVFGVVGPALLLLILTGMCVLVGKTVAQKRQQVKRMAQAKEHLLAKRTCRCQKELTNDYYHA